MDGTETLLSYLTTVQRAAQIAAGTDASVEKLVEETYRRAAAARRAGNTDPARQLLLSELRKLGSGFGDSDAESVIEQVVCRAHMDSAVDHARSALHRVLSGLGSDDWSILVLSEMDGLSADELTGLLGGTAEEMTARLQDIHADVHDHLLAEASPSLRLSLLESLPDEWLARSLEQILQELPRPSDGLRSRIAAAAGPEAKPTSGAHRSSAKKDDPSGPVSRVPQRSFRPVSIFIGIALILAIGFGADYLHSMLSQEPEPDLIVLTARNSERFAFDLETTSLDRAERFLHTHSGMQPEIPRIDGATLRGVGMEEVSPSVHVAAIRYTDDQTDQSITVYAVSYRFLDDNPTVTLSPDVRRQIQSESNFDLHSLGSADVLVWRHRSDIYLAVTDLDGRDLETRITIP